MTGRETTCPTCGGSGDLGSYYAPVPCGACDASGTVEGREATVPCDKWVPQTGKGSAVCNRCGFSVMQHAEMACDYRVEDLQDTWVCVREDGHDLPHRTTRLRATSSRETTCGEEFLSSDKKGRPHTLVCELPQGHPGHCGLAMPPPARDTAPRSDE